MNDSPAVTELVLGRRGFWPLLQTCPCEQPEPTSGGAALLLMIAAWLLASSHRSINESCTFMPSALNHAIRKPNFEPGNRCDSGTQSGADLEDLAASWALRPWLPSSQAGRPRSFPKPPMNFTYRSLLGSPDCGWLFPHLPLSLQLLQSPVRQLHKQSPLPTVTKATWKIKTYANQQWLAKGATPS